MRRHLILGGSGFVGRHVAAELSARGLDVIIAGRRTTVAPELLQTLSIGSPVRYREVDLLVADWGRVLSDVDVVHHYAWSSVPKSANENPVGDFDLHVRGSLNLMEAVRRAGGKRLLFLSSGGTVYGRSSTPSREDDPLQPIGAYGAGKAAVETYLRVYHTAGWLDGRVARLSNPYGAGQDPARTQGVIGIFARLALAGKPLEIWGTGEALRDYIYVCDAARGLADLATAELDHGSELPIFNFGSGEGVSLNSLLHALERSLGNKLWVDRKPGRPYDVPINVLDIMRARELLGWAPQVGLNAGLAETLSASRRGEVALALMPLSPTIAGTACVI